MFKFAISVFLQVHSAIMFSIYTNNYNWLTFYMIFKKICLLKNSLVYLLSTLAPILPSSLVKGFAHRPLSLHPWQIEPDFVIPADRHLAVFTSLAYKDDITFEQWVLLTVSCLGRCKMAVPSFYIFVCIHVMFP